MNILDRFLPGLVSSDPEQPDLDEKSEAEEKARRHTVGYARAAHQRGLQMKNGGSVATISAGQQRRAAKRDADTITRKNTRRYRANWYKNRQAVSVLRGQLVTLGSIKTTGGRYLVGQSPALMENVHNQLVEAYGSVEAAEQHYDSITGAR